MPPDNHHLNGFVSVIIRMDSSKDPEELFFFKSDGFAFSPGFVIDDDLTIVRLL